MIEFQRKTLRSLSNRAEHIYVYIFQDGKFKAQRIWPPGQQITWGLQVLQVQAGVPGSRTETQKLSSFIGCSCYDVIMGRKQKV